MARSSDLSVAAIFDSDETGVVSPSISNYLMKICADVVRGRRLPSSIGALLTSLIGADSHYLLQSTTSCSLVLTMSVCPRRIQIWYPAVVITATSAVSSAIRSSDPMINLFFTSSWIEVVGENVLHAWLMVLSISGVHNRIALYVGW